VSSPLNFHLEHYDGPLDLLLDLIRKQEINIYDIPIAQITSQYLEYMQKALEMDVELSAEFIYMAATLIQIKSKMLLPRDPALQEIAPEEDPRKELVDRLLEHSVIEKACISIRVGTHLGEPHTSAARFQCLDEPGRVACDCGCGRCAGHAAP